MRARDGGAFRQTLVGALRAISGYHSVDYVDADAITAVCPICGGGMAVRFQGDAARANLTCCRGCDELAVVRALAPATGRST